MQQLASSNTLPLQSFKVEQRSPTPQSFITLRNASDQCRGRQAAEAGRCRGHWAPLQTPSTGHHAVLSVLHLTQSSRSQVRSTELKTGGLDLEDAAAE